MMATLSEFNAAPADAAIEREALLREFRNSGIREMDRLWTRPCADYRQQRAAAKPLVDAAHRLDPDRRADIIF
jgi:hypothetical protein